MKQYLIAYQQHLDQEIGRLNSSSLPVNVKSTIFDYKEYCELQNHSIPRILRVVSILRLSALILKIPFLEISRKDYEKFFLLLRRQDKKPGTIDTYKNVLKCFHKWLNNGVFPDCVSWFKLARNKYACLPEELLTPDDVKNLLASANNERDRALISVLWESGARISEVGTLEIRHVAFDDFGCQIMLNGKTGQRRIRLVTSAAYLLEWLNKHPENKNSKAILWRHQRDNFGGVISYNRVVRILQKAAKKAGIQKPINPHHFRHSRATYMAQFLTEAQMKEYFGWKQDSDMAARYVHLSGKQVDDAILKMYGLKKEEEMIDPLVREACPRCKTLNDVNYSYCEKCWLPLTPQAINEVSETQKKDQEAMAAIMKLIELAKGNPQVVQQMIVQVEEKNFRQK